MDIATAFVEGVKQVLGRMIRGGGSTVVMAHEESTGMFAARVCA